MDAARIGRGSWVDGITQPAAIRRLAVSTIILLGLFAWLEREGVTLRGALHPLFQLVLVALLAAIGVSLAATGRRWFYLLLAPPKIAVLLFASKIEPFENGLPNVGLVALMLLGEVAGLVALSAGRERQTTRDRWGTRLVAIGIAGTMAIIALAGLVFVAASPRQAEVDSRTDNVEYWSIDYGGSYGWPRGGIHSRKRVEIRHPFVLLEERRAVR